MIVYDPAIPMCSDLVCFSELTDATVARLNRAASLGGLTGVVAAALQAAEAVQQHDGPPQHVGQPEHVYVPQSVRLAVGRYVVRVTLVHDQRPVVGRDELTK